MDNVIWLLCLLAIIYLVKTQNQQSFSATIRNQSAERIQTLEFSVPALRSSVLFYKAGELQSPNPAISGRDLRLWYPPEEVSNKDFLKSIERAPVVVGTHEASTSEHNKKIDGWPIKVYYDSVKKSAMLQGIVKGNAEAEYVKSLKGSADFGASGYIDARKIEIKSGMTPDGEAYDAIARDLHATHVALLPNVRDPENRIETFNATAQIKNSGALKINGESEKIVEPTGGKMAEENKETDMENAIRNVLSKMEAEKSGAARIDSLEKTLNSLKNTFEEFVKNGKNSEGESDKDKPVETVNTDEGEVLKNAKPAEATIKAFADALSLDLASLRNAKVSDLAKFAGIDLTGKSAIESVELVNAKAKELSAKTVPAPATAQNSESTDSQFDKLLSRGV